jgi:hypothetical protein
VFDVTKIYSAVVSQVVPVGFADLAEAADELSGQEITAGRVRLKVNGRVGTGLAGAVRYAGILRTSSPLLPSAKVEVVVSPWSAGRSEVAIHPLTGLGQFDSLRANRFFKSARAALAVAIDSLFAHLPVEVPEAVELAA